MGELRPFDFEQEWKERRERERLSRLTRREREVYLLCRTKKVQPR